MLSRGMRNHQPVSACINLQPGTAPVQLRLQPECGNMPRITHEHRKWNLCRRRRRDQMAGFVRLGRHLLQVRQVQPPTKQVFLVVAPWSRQVCLCLGNPLLQSKCVNPLPANLRILGIKLMRNLQFLATGSEERIDVIQISQQQVGSRIARIKPGGLHCGLSGNPWHSLAKLDLAAQRNQCRRIRINRQRRLHRIHGFLQLLLMQQRMNQPHGQFRVARMAA